MTGLLPARLGSRGDPRVSPLDDRDRSAVLELCAHDPVANVFVSSRVLALGADAGRLGGQLWGLHRRGRLVAACWAGANVVPVEVSPDAVAPFVERLSRGGRRCSSIVGEAGAVNALWDRLAPAWGRAREVRPDQPLLAIDAEPMVTPDPRVTVATPADLDLLVPASVAMFTEEVGYSPVTADGGVTYRRRVAETVEAGRYFASLEDVGGRRQVIFKAELGAVAPGVVQVQGVWVHPEHRGRGLSAPGVAAVVAQVRRRGMGVTSLYVNGFNDRAIRAYREVGFERVGTFATVLF